MFSESRYCGNENEECKKMGIFRCSRCKNVFYCSKQCQKKDWKVHKDSCREKLKTNEDPTSTEKFTEACHNEMCAKIGALICSQCKSVGYCSKECQKLDWRKHKLSCKLSLTDEKPTKTRSVKDHKHKDGGPTTSRDNSSFPRKRSRPDSEKGIPPSPNATNSCMDDTSATQNFLHLMSGMVLGQNTSVAEEYRRAYPAEKEHFEQIKKEETIYRSIALSRKIGTSSYTDADFTAPQYFVKRWGRCLIAYEHLMEFLSQPDRKVGDIYERRVYPWYQSYSCFQTMHNTAVFNQIYEFGEVYVGFGFVDLFQLWGKYSDNESLQLRFHGFDMSRVVTLRRKLIYGAMKKFQEHEISTNGILQVWLSSCWDSETESSSNKIVDIALHNKAMFNLEGKDEALIRKWKNVNITISKAKKTLFENFRELFI